jgi:hypothetical protein
LDAKKKAISKKITERWSDYEAYIGNFWHAPGSDPKINKLDVLRRFAKFPSVFS